MNDPQLKMIGIRLAHYDITGHLGSGGMGDVYQATDSKLGRSVALKLLPEVFSRDTERVARFEREARVLASLNHAHIAAIHGLENDSGRQFLVIELVPGETLAERIRRGPIPLEDALPIASQICEALAAAHERGIVHRDLKPANIKITPDGVVKVLDFGLAKAYEINPPDSDLSNSPTLAGMDATRAGVILGTAAYMSPEQTKGKAVDRRTDVFAFGCILYEMLTGKPAFDGDDVTDILASVVKAEPDWTRLSANTPAAVQRLLRRCLVKNPADRLHDIADAQLELQEALHLPGGTAAAPKPGRERLAWILAAVFSLATAGAALRLWTLPEGGSTPLWFSIPPPADAFNRSPEPAISFDGRRIAFDAPNAAGQEAIWIRDLDSPSAQALPGTENCGLPFWSPDGRSIAFFCRDLKLKRIDLNGGSPQILADAVNPRGGTWNRDNVILFTPTANEIYRVSAQGGGLRQVTTLAAGETDHLFPSFLPDGNHFLYTVASPDEKRAGLCLGSLDSSERKQLLADLDLPNAEYANGYLIFGRGGELFAQSFDLKTLVLRGEATRLADRLGTMFGPAYAFSIAQDDALVYWNGGVSPVTQPTWTDRSGKTLGTIGEPGEYEGVSLSPDEKNIAVEKTDLKTSISDVWSIDLRTGAETRISASRYGAGTPVWSPDASHILFTEFGNRWFIHSISGGPSADIALASSADNWIDDWSSDGKYVAFKIAPSVGDEWVLPLSGERKPFPVLQSPFVEREARFSPDTHWVAYTSNESGKNEVYVQSFPDPHFRLRISIDGGSSPHWRGDGKELYFIAPDQKMMAAGLEADSGGIRETVPHALFTAPRLGGDAARNSFQVTRDGKRFLFNAAVSDPSFRAINVAIHWTAALRKR